MKDFIFQNTTKIIFGKNKEGLIGKEVKKYSTKILLVYGGGTIKKSGLYNIVIKALKKEGIEVFELKGVKPNPGLRLVEEGIKICLANDINFILAVGGGSVIDTAKTISIGTRYKGNVWDFFSKDIEVKEALPVGVILTIAAAGSESSNGAVITKEDSLKKKFVTSEMMYPKFAILNPELTLSLPPYQTFCGISDIMSHVMERYFTSVKNVDLTDRLCEATLKTVINNAYILIEDPSNYDARAEIMWAGAIAHNDILDTGRTGDWASHLIEHALSGFYDIAHGAGLTIITLAWMKYVYLRNLNRFVQFASRVFKLDVDYNSLERTALKGINALESFFKDIGMPVSLKEIDINKKDFERIALESAREGAIGNLVKLKEKDILKILEIAR